MSVESNKEIIYKILDNGIYYLSNEKKNLNDNLNELNEYLSQYLVNLPTESNELQGQISANSKKISENFYKAIGLLKNIKNRASNLFSNIFINIDISAFKIQLSDSLIFLNDVTFSIAKVKSNIDTYTDDNPINKFAKTLIILPVRFKKTYSQILTLLEDINTNILMTIHQLNNVVEYLLEIENKVHNYSNIDYKKRFEEDTNLLLKQFENQISNLVKTYENQVKVFNLEIKDSTDTVKIAKDNLADIEQKNSDLSSKLAGYERRLQQITESRTEDIKFVLEEKLDELERINNDKISVIDQSYEKAQTNYEKFKDLVEKAGIYNLIINYKDKADDEKEQYKKFRRYTNRAIYWAIGTAIIMFLISWIEITFFNKDTNLLFFIYRMTISLMFFVLAFYSSKQASKHYECFQDNHRTYLQLAALEPFMEQMSEEEKKQIRKNLVPTYFSQANEGKYSSKDDEVTLPADLKGIAEKMIDVGKGLLNKAKDEPKT
ncbi:MAG TPA: hypothetical protein DCS70_01925 [Acinetobacter nosocomialis]|nr:hypothetical protein [Acinetobacter nosocomialis]